MDNEAEVPDINKDEDDEDEDDDDNEDDADFVGTDDQNADPDEFMANFENDEDVDSEERTEEERASFFDILPSIAGNMIEVNSTEIKMNIIFYTI